MQARSLSLLILMSLIVYVLGTASGFATTPPETQYDTQFKITVYETYGISLLKSTKVKGVIVYRGAIKKRALDGMEHLTDLFLQFDAEVEIYVIENVMKSLAKQNDANVVVIDSHITTIKRERIDGPD